jgi:hypothetical protein
MPHPLGSNGTPLPIKHNFRQAYAYVGQLGVEFASTTGEPMIASLGLAGDGITPTIVLRGRNNVHGRVCAACWGYSESCTGERVGHTVTPLDEAVQ